MRFHLARLICAREVRERTRSKFFRIGLALTVIAVIMGVVIPSLASKSAKTPTYSIGVVEPAAQQLFDAIEQTGPTVGAHIIAIPFTSEPEARAALSDDALSAVVVPNQRVLVRTAIDPSLVTTTGRVASAVASVAGSYAGLEAIGLDPQQSALALSHSALDIEGLQAAPHRSAKNAAGASAAIVVLFVFLNLYGAFILNGVIEEKTSRVVEILLSTVRAEELLLGKVIGIGIVGTIQGGVLVIATFVARANTHNLNNGSLSVSLILYTLLWFLIGFGMYAWMYACAGALVSRSEDSQSLVLLLQLPLLASYVMAVVGTINGPSVVGTVLSIFPLTAPMPMLERMSAQEAPLWQIALSISLCVVTIVVVMRLAVVIFKGGVLKSGARVKLREAWRLSS